MRNILDDAAWRTVAGRLAESSAVLLALDFDGTLAPIVEAPDQAALPDSTSGVLRKLVRKPGYRVAILTGRALADIKRRTPVEGLVLCGNHGLEIEIEGRRWTTPGADEASLAVQEAGKALEQALASLPGVVLEDKGLSLSAHYRRASPEIKETCLRWCEQVLAPFVRAGKVKVIGGKEVLEVQPALPWDKGTCLRRLAGLTLSGARQQGACLFVGDDTFDEPAFRAVRELEGIGVVVGEKAGSAAEFFLPSIAGVEIFLRRLVGVSDKG